MLPATRSACVGRRGVPSACSRPAGAQRPALSTCRSHWSPRGLHQSSGAHTAFSSGTAAAPCRRHVCAKSGLGDAVDGWLDVAKLVSGGSTGSKSAYDDLASQIGRDIYVDLAGWHLYLRDMSATAGVKMNVALANKFGPEANKGLRESDVTAVLKKIPVKLGAGRTTVSLFDLLPSFCVGDLTRILEDYARSK